MSILGTRVLRTEDPRFLTSGGVYTEDVVDDRLAGACHVFFVRSPVAHARILAIDVTAAREAPGVVAVFTAADLDDLPLIKPSEMFNAQMTRPVLAADKVRYVGDPVAIVVTEEPYQGEDAVELVDVDYDPLPAVIDLADAASDKVLLYEDAGTNVAANFGDASALDEHLFDECEVVTTRTIMNQRVAPAPMETRAAAAVWGEDGRLTAWIPNQGAQGTQGSLAGLLGVPTDRVHIITPDVGGAFGAKFGADPEHAMVAWVARRARPAGTVDRDQVREPDRDDPRPGAAADGDHRRPAGRHRAGLPAGDRPGLRRPRQDRRDAAVPDDSHDPGPLRNPAGRGRRQERGDHHHCPGRLPGRGPPEATAALERAMDLFAAEIGMDPADVRRRNLLPPFTEPHRTAFGALYDSGDYVAALDKALAAAGYDELRREQAERRARGDTVAAGDRPGQLRRDHRHGGRRGVPPEENATVEVHPDGTATILTGTSPHGQGHATAWAMLASEELGIPVDKITLKWGDTDLVPEGGGTGGSRSLQQGGSAVRQAAQELIEVARERAAHGARGQPRGPASSTSSAARSRWPATRTRRSRWPGWPRRSGCWSGRCSRSRARRSRSARTWRSSRWTPRPAR